MADRARFAGLSYFDADPDYRFVCQLDPADSTELVEIDTGGEDGLIRYRRAGRVSFNIGSEEHRLTVYSMLGYGGGLFLPYRDATSGKETYGGGRYLFDTVKNTDGLGLEVTAGSPTITVDFNYAYNPSCVYDARWACPLAPRENWLTAPIRAGEKMYEGHG